MNKSNKLWNRNFTILWLGSVQSTLGDAFLAIGLLWLVLELTGSPVAASTILVLEGLPKLLGPLVGVVVDRTSKRTLMVGSNLIRGIALLIFYGMHQMGILALWHLYILVVILGFFAIFYTPAFQVMLPNIVPNEKLPAANSIFQGSQQASMIIGASLAGIALATLGTPLALLLDGITFIAAGVLVMLIKFPPELMQESKMTVRKVMSDLWEGLSFIRTTTEIMLLTLVVFVLNMALSPVNIIFPVFAEEVLGGGVEAFGFLASSIAVGLLLGTLVVGVLGDRFTYKQMIAFGLFWMPAMLVALSSTSNLVLALIFTAGVGFGAPFVQVPSVSHLQRSVPVEFQGRVFATLGSVIAAAVPLSAAIAGQSLVAFAPATLFVGAGCGILAIAIVWVLLNLRKPRVIVTSTTTGRTTSTD